jgi:RHS repeat-associated protein
MPVHRAIVWVATVLLLLSWPLPVPAQSEEGGDYSFFHYFTDQWFESLDRAADVVQEYVDEELADSAPEESETPTGTSEAEPPVEQTAEADEESEDSSGDGGSERARMALPGGANVSAVNPQAIALPNGGGTIEGMGESFQPLLSSGQARLSLPLAFQPGRAGAGPGMALTYTSGGGNSTTGLGWSLGVPFIARQTDKGLPRYEEGSLDRFIYNGGQELVPIASTRTMGTHVMPEGEEWPQFVAGSGQSWTYFRARIEGSFMRFFLRGDERQWVVQDTDGNLYIFGGNGSSAGSSEAVMDFEDDLGVAVYRWNLTAKVDRSGNRVEYRYFREGGQSYLEHVAWNNPLDALDATVDPGAPPPGSGLWDGLGEYQHHIHLTYEPRQDAFSSYVSGFRVETGLRLSLITVASKSLGEGLGGPARVVRRYDLGYDPDSILSLLTSVQLLGPRCMSTTSAGCSPQEGGSLPAMRFGYSGPTEGVRTEGYGYLHDQVEHAVSSPPYRIYNNFVDLFDANYDGLPDVLLTDPIRYHGGHGLYIAQLDGSGALSFSRAEDVTCRKSWPSGSCRSIGSSFKFTNRNIRPLDFDGDGRVEYLHMPSYRQYRYYRMAHDGDDPLTGYWWAEHGPFDPLDEDIELTSDSVNVRAVDVNNDHHIDVIRTAGNRIQTYLSLAGCPEGQGKFGTPEYGPWGTCVGFVTEPIESCALHRGRPMDFSNEKLRIADMNGDGVQDIVAVDRFRIAYWPGRGPGVWGAGDRDCTVGLFAGDREVPMDNSPSFNIGNRYLYMGDVNQDGTSDIVEVRMHDVKVHLNLNGTSWSEGYVIDNTPWQRTSQDDDIRMADMNGSGSTDVIWGISGEYSYLDVTGGQTPRLLNVIENSLGGRTEIFYDSSTRLMAEAREASHPWSSTTPRPVTVVSRTVATDGFGSRQEMQYEYRDPVFDTQEAEFRGFRQALARSVGDDNTPTAVTVSSFHAGERPEWACRAVADDHECRQLDNPHEALKGAAYLTETRTDTDSSSLYPWSNPDPWNPRGETYLQSAHTTYTVDKLYDGLDGRGVWHAWPSQSDSFRYGTDGEQSSGAAQEVPHLVVREVLPGAAGASEVSNETASVAVRASGSEAVHLSSSVLLNRFGHRLVESNDGIVGYAGDEVTSRQQWTYNPDNWIHRVCASWTDGKQSDADRQLGYTLTYYEGNESQLCVVGDRGLATYTQVRSSSRLADGSRSSARYVPQQITTYNAQGLVAESWAGVSPGNEGNALRHSRRVYDDDYGAYVVEESFQVNRADQPAAYLTVSATWDAGRGVVTSVTDHSGHSSYVSYDVLGRQTALYRPLCQEPATVYQYQLWPQGRLESGRSWHFGARLHHVRTLTNEICDRPGTPAPPSRYHDPLADLDTSTGMLEAYAVVDGWARVRATLSQGDPLDEIDWILAGVKEYDARGNVRRSYQPLSYGDRDNVIRGLDLRTVDSLYEEAKYDGFGRTTWTSYVDGKDATKTIYGARYSHTFDGNDLDPTSDHQGTPTTTVYDGQDRVVAVLERTSNAGEVGQVQAMRYDSLGNVVSVSRGSGSVALGGAVTFSAGQSTTRYLLYDSLGQRTHTLDPDGGTYLYFYNQLGELVRTIDARGVENRYVYDVGGRLVAEDHSSDGASWAETDNATGENTDDRAGLSRLATLTAELFAYEQDTDNDFLPEGGGDVLYGYDSPYDSATNMCRAAPELPQTYVLGRASWVRDPSGCSWSSYDERGRATWSARQVDPGEQVFVTAVSYDGPDGPDDLNRVRSETFPDGTSVHFSFSRRGLLESVTGQAPDSSSLFSGRTFVEDIRHDEFGQRTSWLLGDSTGNQTTTTYRYDVRRRLHRMNSRLETPLGEGRTLANNGYSYDEVGNIESLSDFRGLSQTQGWAPDPVSYEYEYDALYRLTRAIPQYGSLFSPDTRQDVRVDIRFSPSIEDLPGYGRVGMQEWTHDALGSMRTWTADDVLPVWMLDEADETTTEDHFYKWSLGDIVNGQQLIEAGAELGVSTRCALVPEAAARVSGPAPHALYFAYQANGSDGGYNGLEACYDASGNMVALHRLELSDCGGSPLAPAVADWDCNNQSVVWELQLAWDAVGRLARVEKFGGEGDADIRHVYDATDTRVIRLDHESTEGAEQATLYVSKGYEIRDASLDLDGSYYGGEETKFVYAGDQRVARVVERVADGVTEWPNAPGGAYVFQTITNHLGSASVTFNANSLPGQDPIVVAQTQLPYGAEDARVDNPDYGGWKPDYEFTGKEEDPDVGLMYFGARFYAPGMGRWPSADPLAVHSLNADRNAYRYVSNNPLVLVDPSGEEGTLALAIGGAVLAPEIAVAALVGVAVGVGIWGALQAGEYVGEYLQSRLRRNAAREAEIARTTPQPRINDLVDEPDTPPQTSPETTTQLGPDIQVDVTPERPEENSRGSVVLDNMILVYAYQNTNGARTRVPAAMDGRRPLIPAPVIKEFFKTDDRAERAVWLGEFLATHGGRFAKSGYQADIDRIWEQGQRDYSGGKKAPSKTDAAAAASAIAENAPLLTAETRLHATADKLGVPLLPRYDPQ